MADITGTPQEIVNSKQNGITLHVLYETITTTNRTTAAFVNPNFKNVCFQAKGTFSAGTPHILIEGTNDESSETWAGVGDASATAIDLTAAGIATVYDAPYKLRARLTGGDGSTDIDITVTASTTVRK